MSEARLLYREQALKNACESLSRHRILLKLVKESLEAMAAKTTDSYIRTLLLAEIDHIHRETVLTKEPTKDAADE